MRDTMEFREFNNRIAIEMNQLEYNFVTISLQQKENCTLRLYIKKDIISSEEMNL